jgi:hypothetical protein
MPTGPLGEVANNSNFFVAFTTTAGYEKAASKLIESLPPAWQGKYIQINQNASAKNYEVAEDGHIVVNMARNMFQFGNWVGIQYLIDNNVIPRDAWFLFLHDTCICGVDTQVLVERSISELNKTTNSISWLTNDALGYLCLARNIGITYGAAFFNTKNHNNAQKKRKNWHKAKLNSPLTFDVKQHFPDKPAIEGQSGPIYSDKIIRKPMYIEGYDLTKNIYLSTVIIQANSHQA